MYTILGKFAPQSYALMRIVVGFLFACHGAQKMFGVLGGFGGEPGNTAPLFHLMGLAGVIELVGGILIMIGLATGLAAFICSGQMASAYWMSHGPNALFPLQNRGELAVVYCFVFLFIATTGAGIWSVDAVRKGKS